MAEWISLTEFAKWHGWSTKWVRTLAGKGMPSRKVKAKKGGGKPRYQFNQEECIKWLSIKGHVSKGMKNLADQNRPTPAPPSVSSRKDDTSGFDIDKDLANRPGLLGTYERAKLAEYTTATLIMQRKRDGDTDDAERLQRLYIKEVSLVQKLSEAVDKYQVTRGKLIDADIVRTLWTRIGTAFQNSVMSIGADVAPIVRQHMKSPDDVEAVRQVIDEKARDILLMLSGGLPEQIDVDANEN